MTRGGTLLKAIRRPDCEICEYSRTNNARPDSSNCARSSNSSTRLSAESRGAADSRRAKLVVSDPTKSSDEICKVTVISISTFSLGSREDLRRRDHCLEAVPCWYSLSQQ